MSYKKWVEFSQLTNDIRLKDWAIRRLAGTSESINLDEYQDLAMKPNMFKALMLRNVHGSHVFRECSIFGEDEIMNRKICDHLINQVVSLNTPRLADIYKIEGLNSNRVLNIAIVMTKHINCSSDYIMSDLYYHYLESAKAAGHQAIPFDSSNLMYSQFPKNITIHDAIAELETFLSKNKPDVVLADGNFVPTNKTISAEIWLQLKTKYNFKLVVIIADSYDSQPDYYQFWDKCSDIIISFNRITSHFRFEEKNLYCPCIGFYQSIFQNNTKKDIDLLYIGTNSRNRLIWIQGMSLGGIQTYAILHERKKPIAPDIQEYGELMSRAKLVFNNGWVNDSDNILTGRFFESILAGAVVIQEVGSNVNEFFTPYKHYIPVSNLTQAINFANYLLANEHVRSSIANEALNFFNENYHSNLFWKFLLQKISLD